MTLSSQHRTVIEDCEAQVADVLLVRISPAATGSLPSDLFSLADNGREALGMLKLFRFNLLLASLDVPDMRPWELFQRARRAQARLQCALLDERLTIDDEQRVRQTGAGAFASIDPSICEAIVRSSSRITWPRSDADRRVQSIGPP
jgi:hypothetical protein